MRSERARLRQQAPIFHIGPTGCRLDHAGSEISPLEPTRLRESDDGLKPEQEASFGQQAVGNGSASGSNSVVPQKQSCSASSSNSSVEQSAKPLRSRRSGREPDMRTSQTPERIGGQITRVVISSVPSAKRKLRRVQHPIIFLGTVTGPKINLASRRWSCRPAPPGFAHSRMLFTRLRTKLLPISARNAGFG